MVKFQRAVGNLDKDEILKKRNEKPEARKLQREQAIKKVKKLVRA